MRVKELIKYLEKQNPDDIVILRDFGADTGDIVIFEKDEFDKLNSGGMEANIRIMSYDNILEEMKTDQHWEVEKFIEKYGKR